MCVYANAMIHILISSTRQYFDRSFLRNDLAIKVIRRLQTLICKFADKAIFTQTSQQKNNEESGIY